VTGVCGRKQRLADEMLASLRNLMNLQSRNTQTILDGDAELPDYTEQLGRSRMAWENAKTAYFLHIREHGC
jgi:hypothetical protein